MDIVKTVPQAITTSCTNVPLGQSPYNWNSIFFSLILGVVKSGYLNVGPKKGNSALAFIFYGK
jgi:hypothetical protein